LACITWSMFPNKIKPGSTVSTYIQAIHVNTLTALSKLQVTSVLVSAL
jgi:hypothetical protein